MSKTAAPSWMSHILRMAGVYNVLWGVWSVLFPTHFWSLVGMRPPEYLFLWQCIGMIVGVYGVGYWIAASNPTRHWPIVLVGLLGKVFGPIGFLHAWLIDGSLPFRFGITLLTNDLLWWIPFVVILRYAYRSLEQERQAGLLTPPLHSLDFQQGGGVNPKSDFGLRLATAYPSSGAMLGPSLAERSQAAPQLVVFLRHLGCTFCRETLADLARVRPHVEAAGVKIVLVHMVADDQAASVFATYGLADVPRLSDPNKQLYRAFELRRGTLAQLFGPHVWLRGIGAGLWQRHGVGWLQGDGFQMPGAFVVHQGRIVRAFRHADAADRPDYCALAAAH